MDSRIQDDQTVARWIVEHADEVLRSSSAVRDPLKLSKSLRKKKLDTNLARDICLIHSLRLRAAAKFTAAERMFFTPLGYEQSTSQAIASYKARRFQGLSVVDLCCGIGGDAMSLAGRAAGLTIVDLSPRTLEFAKANVALTGHQISHLLFDVRQVSFCGVDAWHLDPDRRVDGHRKSDPDQCEPPLDEFLSRKDLPKDGAIKLAPAADASRLLQRGAELEWIGCQQECRQQVAWLGELARHPGKKTATWIGGKQSDEPNEIDHLVEDTSTSSDLNVTDQESRYLYEPRSPVLASGLLDSLASQFELDRLAGSTFFTSDHWHESLMFRRYVTLGAMPYRPKDLERFLTHQSLRVTEVKKQGVDIHPEKVLAQLSSKLPRGVGDTDCVLTFLRKGRTTWSLITRRDD